MDSDRCFRTSPNAEDHSYSESFKPEVAAIFSGFKYARTRVTIQAWICCFALASVAATAPVHITVAPDSAALTPTQIQQFRITGAGSQ